MPIARHGKLMHKKDRKALAIAIFIITCVGLGIYMMKIALTPEQGATQETFGLN